MKPLGWIAVCGFLIAALCLPAAVALSDSWRGIPWEAIFDDDEVHERVDTRDRTPTERRLEWQAGEALTISVPADVTFTDAPDVSFVAQGPAWMVNRLELDGDRLRFDGRRIRNFHGDKLTVIISAPNVRAFTLNGAGRLTVKDLTDTAVSLELNGAGEVRLENLKSDTLSLDTSGASSITASGEAAVVTLDLSGASSADLSTLKTRRAEIEISGLGSVKAAPSEDADVEISGAGSVVLRTRPPRLNTKISGAGSVRIEEEERTPPKPPSTDNARRAPSSAP